MAWPSQKSPFQVPHSFITERPFGVNFGRDPQNLLECSNVLCCITLHVWECIFQSFEFSSKTARPFQIREAVDQILLLSWNCCTLFNGIYWVNDFLTANWTTASAHSFWLSKEYHISYHRKYSTKLKDIQRLEKSTFQITMSEPSVKNVPTSVSTPAEICDKEIANELQNLREELDRFYQNGKSSDLNAVRRAFGASPKVNQESRVDWRTNHIVRMQKLITNNKQ